jgi:hypothetical protein
LPQHDQPFADAILWWSESNKIFLVFFVAVDWLILIWRNEIQREIIVPNLDIQDEGNWNWNSMNWLRKMSADKRAPKKKPRRKLDWRLGEVIFVRNIGNGAK